MWVAICGNIGQHSKEGCLAAAGNGSSTSVPFRRTRRTPPTSPTDVPSTDSQSIEGCGLPEAEQSSQPPEELENSSRDGGSITNDGPRRSYLAGAQVNLIELTNAIGSIT
uniref:Uncharacterized protein n=1 Tax=Anopheles farauti TaxID=69004 RepID=A0A182QT62_9DIPT